MKKLFKRGVLLCLLLVAALLLASCSGGIDTDKAKADARDFLTLVENGNYTGAATYLHPDRAGDLAAYFTRVEEREHVDFSAGIEILSESGVSYAYYDSDIEGSTYELDLDVRIGGVRAEIEIKFVENDRGYGVYNIEIDIED